MSLVYMGFTVRTVCYLYICKFRYFHVLYCFEGRIVAVNVPVLGHCLYFTF